VQCRGFRSNFMFWIWKLSWDFHFHHRTLIWTSTNSSFLMLIATNSTRKNQGNIVVIINRFRIESNRSKCIFASMLCAVVDASLPPNAEVRLERRKSLFAHLILIWEWLPFYGNVKWRRNARRNVLPNMVKMKEQDERRKKHSKASTSITMGFSFFFLLYLHFRSLLWQCMSPGKMKGSRISLIINIGASEAVFRRKKKLFQV
jgi:hypothetical protein